LKIEQSLGRIANGVAIPDFKSPGRVFNVSVLSHP
jgi:hypothetical protein